MRRGGSEFHLRPALQRLERLAAAGEEGIAQRAVAAIADLGIEIARRFGEINVNRFFAHADGYPEIALVAKEPVAEPPPEKMSSPPVTETEPVLVNGTWMLMLVAVDLVTEPALVNVGVVPPSAL